MADTTAPVTDLRERIEAAVERWFDLPDDLAPNDEMSRQVADVVLAALAGDPGDLPARMETEIRDRVRLRLGPRALEQAADGPIMLSGTEAEAIARAAMSVRWEYAARQAAEVGRLRAELAEAREWSAELRGHVTALREMHRKAGAERDALKAAIERVRRMAQVWIDIRPAYPTATREGHVMADAGQQILAALDGGQ